MTNSIVLNIQDNAGYSPEQVAPQSITLGDLLSAVQEAIAEAGEDAKVVLSNGQTYGAGYGFISKWSDVFEPTELPEGQYGE